ncbi:MAG: methyltransferase [Oscillospiraceae bacterium]|nr:methyltransferase [Oscillospiraceae bacterium]
MSNFPFDPKELEIKRRAPSFIPDAPGTALFNFPMSEREAYKSMILDKKPVWMPYGVETSFFSPHIIPDDIARGFVIEAEPWKEPYTKHPDMFGIHWVYVPVAGGSMEDPDYPHPLEDVNDWKEVIKFPDIYSWDWEGSGRMNKEWLKNNGKANVFWFLNGMGFERLVSFMGFENAAMALLDEDQEDALHELLEALTNLHIKMVDCIVETYGEGITAIDLHDDWGSQKSPFFSTAVAKEFFVPEWKRFTDHIHSKGMIADLHSCGHIEAQIENIIDGGWDTWTPMAMNDTHALYEKYGDRFCFSVCADKWDPATATPEEQYEAGKAFAEKFFRPGKVAAYSFYSGLPMTDDFARGIYETSRKMC